jgi:hypothetical protein
MQMVRTYSAGVFAGELDETTRSADGKRGIVRNARRMWYWEGAASLSELATRGTSRPKECKFPAIVAEVELMEIIEVIPMAPEAIASIALVPVWSA